MKILRFFKILIPVVCIILLRLPSVAAYVLARVFDALQEGSTYLHERLGALVPGLDDYVQLRAGKWRWATPAEKHAEAEEVSRLNRVEAARLMFHIK